MYGKAKMATFERYFIRDEKLRKEQKNIYYQLIEKERSAEPDPGGVRPAGHRAAHIINGHMPVQTAERAEAACTVTASCSIIDGGFAKAYQKETGIAGYTLVYNSYGLRLVAHEPFESTEAAIEKESDIHSETTIVEQVLRRRSVGDTDVGRDLKSQIADLEKLLQAYRDGTILETGMI